MAIIISQNRLQIERPRDLGIALPIQKSSKDGIFEMTHTTADKVKSQLYNLFFTTPGERVMLPEFGISLQNKLFDNLDEVLFAEIRKDIVRQVGKFVPECEIIKINFNQIENNLDVEVQYSLKNDSSIKDILEITIR